MRVLVESLRKPMGMFRRATKVQLHLTDAMQPIMAGAESQCIMPTALLYSSGMVAATVLMALRIAAAEVAIRLILTRNLRVRLG
jgi:hypothetical protein